MTKAKTLRLCGIILSASLFAGGGGASVNSAQPLRQRLADAGAGVMVVAHRGCHAAAPTPLRRCAGPRAIRLICDGWLQ